MLAGRRSVYSWADSCWSLSRQALIFRRRQTQQRSSSLLVCGPVNGVEAAPQTGHRLEMTARSTSMDLFAISKIRGEMIGSAAGFFFISAFTIAQMSG
jgi:hypothetical protein